MQHDILTTSQAHYAHFEYLGSIFHDYFLRQSDLILVHSAFVIIWQQIMTGGSCTMLRLRTLIIVTDADGAIRCQTLGPETFQGGGI